MTDRLGRIAPDELEAGLTDLAAALAFPPTPDIATAVSSRLRAPLRAHRPVALPPPLRRSVPRSLLLAAALALLIVGGALAVRFGLDLLSIEFGPVPSTAPRPTEAPGPGTGASPGAPTPGLPGTGLGLGEPLTLEAARAAATWDLRTPIGLGPPEAVYLGSASLRGQVAFVYAPRAALPASDLLGGAGLLVTQNRGEPDDGLAHKLAETGQATVELVSVNGAPGVWISGRPHFFWYLAEDGSVIQESRRLVGDTLAWEVDGVLYRIEGAIDLAQALEIARSLR